MSCNWQNLFHWISLAYRGVNTSPQKLIENTSLVMQLLFASQTPLIVLAVQQHSRNYTFRSTVLTYYSLWIIMSSFSEYGKNTITTEQLSFFQKKNNTKKWQSFICCYPRPTLGDIILHCPSVRSESCLCIYPRFSNELTV